MDGRTWVNNFADLLGIEPPDEDTFLALLELAGTAAHASERLAAPIACYLLGRAGLDVAAGQRAAHAANPG